MGKTRLAQELGRACLATFADGVVYVALAPLADSVALAPTILAALDWSWQHLSPAERAARIRWATSAMSTQVDLCEAAYSPTPRQHVHSPGVNRTVVSATGPRRHWNEQEHQA